MLMSIGQTTVFNLYRIVRILNVRFNIIVHSRVIFIFLCLCISAYTIQYIGIVGNELYF